jgi:CRP/FNR family cyclic AMP-dependent transcriptional regulator
MLLTIEKVLILKSVSIFSSVPEGQLVDLATIVESVEYEAGEIIMTQGDLGTSMYIVVDGRGIMRILCEYTRQNLARTKS